MSDLSERVRLMFTDATEKEAARDVRTPRQWKDMGALNDQAQAEKGSFEKERVDTYKGRVETEERRLLHREGAKDLTYEPWGLHQPMMDPAARRLQAHRNVRSADATAALTLDKRHSDSRAEFLRRCRRTNRIRGLLREDFNRGPRR